MKFVVCTLSSLLQWQFIEFEIAMLSCWLIEYCQKMLHPSVLVINFEIFVHGVPLVKGSVLATHWVVIRYYRVIFRFSSSIFLQHSCSVLAFLLFFGMDKSQVFQQSHLLPGMSQDSRIYLPLLQQLKIPHQRQSQMNLIKSVLPLGILVREHLPTLS